MISFEEMFKKEIEDNITNIVKQLAKQGPFYECLEKSCYHDKIIKMKWHATPRIWIARQLIKLAGWIDKDGYYGFD
jgi:hypothetical protein